MKHRPTISVIFSKNKKIGSWVVRAGSYWEADVPFNECPSHVAVLVDNRWVVESTVTDGFRVISYKKWLELNELIGFSDELNNIDYKTVFRQFRSKKGARYDWMGVAYLGWRLALKLIFKRPLPKTNAWHSPDKYFCSEVISKLTGRNYEMTTPARLLMELT